MLRKQLTMKRISRRSVSKRFRSNHTKNVFSCLLTRGFFICPEFIALYRQLEASTEIVQSLRLKTEQILETFLGIYFYTLSDFLANKNQ